MRKMNDYTKKVFEYLKTAKEVRNTTHSNGALAIGTIFNHTGDTRFIVVGVDVNLSSKIEKLSVKEIKTTDTEIKINVTTLWTSSMNNVHVDYYDGVAYIENLLVENTKKDILNQQIKDLESKINEMKQEVKTL
jgi:hypothetical protein